MIPESNVRPSVPQLTLDCKHSCHRIMIPSTAAELQQNDNLKSSDRKKHAFMNVLSVDVL